MNQETLLNTWGCIPGVPLVFTWGRVADLYNIPAAHRHVKLVRFSLWPQPAFVYKSEAVCVNLVLAVPAAAQLIEAVHVILQPWSL